MRSTHGRIGSSFRSWPAAHDMRCYCAPCFIATVLSFSKRCAVLLHCTWTQCKHIGPAFSHRVPVRCCRLQARNATLWVGPRQPLSICNLQSLPSPLWMAASQLVDVDGRLPACGWPPPSLHSTVGAAARSIMLPHARLSSSGTLCCVGACACTCPPAGRKRPNFHVHQGLVSSLHC